MPWFDIGVNLDDRRILKNLEVIVKQCDEHKVTHWLAIGTDLASSSANIEIASREELNEIQLTFTAGFHPHYADQADDAALRELARLAASVKISAIGECGLDFNRNFSSKKNQIKAFEWQLALAVELQKPIYLHERDAFDEQIKLLEKYAHKLCGGVLHCFTGEPASLSVYLDFGLYIGVTGWVCDPQRGEKLRQSVQSLPLDKLLLETDSPYLTPKHIKPRPKYNHPALLPSIGEYIAFLKNIDVRQVEQASFENALRLFNIAESSL